MKFIKYICKGVLETGKCPYRYDSYCYHGKEHEKYEYSCCNSGIIDLYCNCMPITLEYKMRKAIKEEERK
jgi:hypothetical protein